MMRAAEWLEQWIAQWPERLEARDNSFITRLCDEITALDEIGYDAREKKQALSGRLYIKTWASCPRWMEHADKLPAPLKWRDGKAYKRPKCSAVKVVTYSTAMFLSYRDCGPVGTRRDEKVVIVVHGFRGLSLQDLSNGLPNGQSIDWELRQIAKEHGMRITNNHVHFLRDVIE